VLILKAMNTRDALLSRACGLAWPFGPLLDALDLLPDAAVLDIGAGKGGLLENLRRRGHTGLLIGLDTKLGSGVQSGEAGALPFADAYFDPLCWSGHCCTLPARSGHWRKFFGF